MRARLVQLRLGLWPTSEEYVTERGWESARLECCPVHGAGAGCGFARHGAYPRRTPPGTWIARYYCPKAHITFSLLPDCLASRLPSTLAEVEAVVRGVEEAPTWEVAADRLRSDIELPGALRWLRRRVAATHASLSALIGLDPETFAGCMPTLASFAEVLKYPGPCWFMLVMLRGSASSFLSSLPPMLGFGPRTSPRWSPAEPGQQQKGPDPPSKPR